MTNESKAKEIYDRETDKGFHLGTHSLMEMADWKDQQFKEYLERKEMECTEWYDDKEPLKNIKRHRRELLNEIINELFKS